VYFIYIRDAMGFVSRSPANDVVDIFDSRSHNNKDSNNNPDKPEQQNRHRPSPSRGGEGSRRWKGPIRQWKAVSYNGHTEASGPMQ